MSPLAKLVTGIAASGLLANGAYIFERQSLLADLGKGVAPVMLVHGVSDGGVRWKDDAGYTRRFARLSGTADAANRARILAEVRTLPGLAGADWSGAR